MLTTVFESSLSKTFCAWSGGNLSMEVITLAIVFREKQDKNQVSLKTLYLVTATFDTSQNYFIVSLRQLKPNKTKKGKKWMKIISIINSRPICHRACISP